MAEPDVDDGPTGWDHPSAIELMDATDRLLGQVGYAGISSRKITDAAGLAHGSIRYHFGSLQRLLVTTLGRRNDTAYERQAALYHSGRTTREIWRTATRDYVDRDLESGWAQRLVEALLIGIRDPEAGRALAEVLEPWRGLIHEATRAAVDEYGLDISDRFADGISALVETSQLGMLVHRMVGNDQHHEAALDAVDALLRHLERRVEPRSDVEGPP